jgi:bisphosphoglycerate-independent phosphoglycerate mutase (AlkP superfamily)
VISAEHAGRNLALLAARYDLTMFAHYATDYAGHQQDMDAAIAALERVDAFLAGLLDTAADDLVIFIVSDHGNIEDVRTGHTRNPALGIVTGTGHRQLADRLRSLTDVTPAILHALTL